MYFHFTRPGSSNMFKTSGSGRPEIASFDGNEQEFILLHMPCQSSTQYGSKLRMHGIDQIGDFTPTPYPI